MTFSQTTRTTSLPLSMLINKAKNGDVSAYSQIYRHFVQDIYCYIRARVNNQHQAEDLTQDVFIKAWKNISGLKKNSIKTWLYTIARNSVYDYYRTQKPTLSLQNLTHLLIQPAYILSQLLHQEQNHYLLNLITKLKPTYQDIIIFRYIHELSIKQTAAILQLTPENVRVKTHRAIKQLRLLYDQNQT